MTDKKSTPVSPTTTGAADPDDKLLADLESAGPEAWMPKVAGDTIIGAFIRVGSGVTAFGPAHFAVLGTTDGERSVWLFYEALRSGFATARPAPGERIAIRYMGEVPAKNPVPGRKATYHDFRVSVDRPVDANATPNWDLIAGDTTDRDASGEPSDGPQFGEAPI